VAVSVRRMVVPLLVVVVAALVRAVTAEAVSESDDTPDAVGADKGDLSVEAIDASSGSPLAVRVRVVPRSPLRDEQVLVARDGTVHQALDSGGYRVLVTHGPEWSVSEHEVEVAPERPVRLRAALSRLVDGRHLTACELHVHTRESPDSEIALEERIDSLLAEDVHFVVLTDHNVVTQGREALAAAGIGSLPGVEVTTWDPEFGHFNVFPRSHAPRYKRTSSLELLREVRSELESFIQINHPRLEPHIGYFSLSGYVRALGRTKAGEPLSFDAVEVWNGYDLSSPRRRDEIFLDWLALAARGQRISATGGSDAHATSRAPYVGYPRTYVSVPRLRAGQPQEVLAALKQGRSFVTNGPLLAVDVLGKGPGDLLRVTSPEQTLTVRVQLDSPAWMGPFALEIWLGEQRVVAQALAAPPPGERTQRTTARFELMVGEARSLVVAARGEASMQALLARDARPYAFTNPIWIEGG